jgi:metal-responsive CopG/Arc/MetJ family transcriptional regulator
MGKKPISFKADDELIREIERYAYKKRISRGETIRRAIENFLEEELEKETNPKESQKY